MDEADKKFGEFTCKKKSIKNVDKNLQKFPKFFKL